MPSRRAAIAETLRQRVVAGLHLGTLEPGHRLPSLRVLGAELRTDPRVVMAAYRQLAAEGLVRLRPRSGVFVEAPPRRDEEMLPEVAAWVVDVFLRGLSRDIPRLDHPVPLRGSGAAREAPPSAGAGGDPRSGLHHRGAGHARPRARVVALHGSQVRRQAAADGSRLVREAPGPRTASSGRDSAGRHRLCDAARGRAPAAGMARRPGGHHPSGLLRRHRAGVARLPGTEKPPGGTHMRPETQH